MKNILLTITLVSSLSAGVLNLDKELRLDIERQAVSKQAESLKKALIEPVTLGYINKKGNDYDSETFSLSIKQPIFKSGGIYYTIKYASALEAYQLKVTNLSRQELIKQVYSLSLKLQKLDLKLKRQQLLINNSLLEIEEKQNKFLNGLTNISDLDNAILQKNNYSNDLLNLEMEKEELLASYKYLSSYDYNKIEIPRMTLMDEATFLHNNSNVQKNNLFVKAQDYNKQLTLSRYLPTVSLTYEYNDFIKENKQTMASNKEAVGISISLPLYFNGYTEYERAQLNFLKSTVVLRESKDEEQKFFFKSLKNMATIDQKKHIANDDKNRYKSLLTRVEALYNNGLESEHTLLRLQNSYKIRELDLIDLELDKTMIMIDVYAKVEEF